MKFNKLAKLTLSTLALAIAQSSQAGVVMTEDADLVLKTKGGLELRTTDNQFKFKFGGRIMWDYGIWDGVYSADAQQDREEEGYLRRGRLEFYGTYRLWDYVAVIDVGQGTANNSNTRWDEVGTTYNGFKLGKIFVGRGKEPFGLEELGSSKWTSTIERALMWGSTTSDTNSDYGLRFSGYRGPFTYSTGVFNTAENDVDAAGADARDDNYAWTSRVTFAPIADKGRVLHFGAAYSDRGIEPGINVRLLNAQITRAGAVANVRSGNIAADELTQWGLEAAFLKGPLSLQTEWLNVDLDAAPGVGDGDAQSYYLQATYTLTGESRDYKVEEAIFDKIKPANPSGAVELVAKYDNVETNQEGAAADPEADAKTLGINWYANENVKLALNYILADTNNIAAAGAEEDGHIILGRLQFAF